MTIYDLPKTNVDMIVTQINASCDASKAELTRTMSLKDKDSFGTYHSKLTMQMPALDGVGTGDVLKLSIVFKHSAMEYELIREAELQEDRNS